MSCGAAAVALNLKSYPQNAKNAAYGPKSEFIAPTACFNRRVSSKIAVMKHTEAAAAVFEQGVCCSQAVLAAYAAEYGLDRYIALKIAAGFGAGMGRMTQTCGAVTGAYMVLGLKYGAASGDREAKERTYRAVREFAQRFKERNGALGCKELLGCDISKPEEFAKMKSLGLHVTVCSKMVHDACVILDELLKG